MNEQSKTLRFSARPMLGLMVLLLVATLLPAMPSAAAAPARTNPLADLDREQQRVFKAYTRLFCKQFFRYGEKRYVLLPNHMRNRENSSGMSMDQAQEVMTEVKKIRRGLATVEQKFLPPHGEVVARAMLLPEMEVGHYGFVSSVKINQIVGPEEMIVTAVKLIPSDALGAREKSTWRRKAYNQQNQFQHKSFRLLGFKTENFSEGQTWSGAGGKGIQIAVISTDPASQNAFVLVNFEKLQPVRTSEFADALAYVHLEPQVFMDLVRDNKVELGAKGDTASLITIYRRFYNRYQPSRVTKAPPKPKPVPPPRDEQEQDDEPKYTLNPPPKDDEDEPTTTDTDEPVEDEPETDDPATATDDDEVQYRWEYDEEKDDSPEDPTFFGIPLDG